MSRTALAVLAALTLSATTAHAQMPRVESVSVTYDADSVRFQATFDGLLPFFSPEQEFGWQLSILTAGEWGSARAYWLRQFYENPNPSDEQPPTPLGECVVMYAEPPAFTSVLVGNANAGATSNTFTATFPRSFFIEVEPNGFRWHLITYDENGRHEDIDGTVQEIDPTPSLRTSLGSILARWR